MATDKKGFILYADQKELFDQLPNDKAGELIKHIFSYVNDESPETNDLLLKLAFTPIKQQLKMDLKKFEEVKIKRSEAGKKSAEARRNKSQQTPTKSTSVKSVEQTSTKSTVKENVNVTVNDNVKDKDINKKAKAFKTQKEFLEWFNKGKEYYTGVKGKTKTMSKTDINNFKKINEVYTRPEFGHALKMLTKSKWAIDENMIIPAHFLRIDNFTKYLNQEEKNDNRISMNLPAN